MILLPGAAWEAVPKSLPSTQFSEITPTDEQNIRASGWHEEHSNIHILNI